MFNTVGVPTLSPAQAVVLLAALDRKHLEWIKARHARCPFGGPTITPGEILDLARQAIRESTQ